MTTPARIRADLDDALARLIKLRYSADDIIAAMLARHTGQPGAASYDGTRGPTSVLWCFRHESDPRNCCGEGEPVPRSGDPTGEAAISRDQAHADMRELAKKIHDLRAIADRLHQLETAYTSRGPTAKERREAEADSWPICESCARTEVARGIQRQEPARQRGKLHVHLDGKLRELHLCRWCQDFTRETGLLPTMAELDAHHR